MKKYEEERAFAFSLIATAVSAATLNNLQMQYIFFLSKRMFFLQ